MPDPITAGLLILILLVLAFIAYRQSKSGVEESVLRSALSESWRELGLEKSVGQIQTHADNLTDIHGDISQMLRLPKERGEFGEQQLDVILGDHLPQDMYGVRKQVVDGKTPDAHIKSTSGTICIDSKFPLDNYEKYMDAKKDQEEQEAESYKKEFRANVENQLEKIGEDYIQPENGTTDFAFAFIPSEAVYHHLITEEHDLLRRYTKRGVQVVSPLTLGHKLELVKADVHARELSEKAEQIQSQLQTLGSQFDEFEDEWGTFYTHIRNAKNKADDLETVFGNLQSEFQRISEQSPEEN